MGCLCCLFPVWLTSASNTVSCWDLPFSSEYRWVLLYFNPMTLGYTVHWYLLEHYIAVCLMCQAIRSTQSSKTSCPVSTHDWRQSPSILIRVTHFLWKWLKKPFNKIRSKISLSTLRNFLLEEYPFAIISPYNSFTCFIPLPHVLCMVT